MTQLDSDKFGICKLCLQQDLLRDSHIISEFLYASMYDDRHRFHVLAAGDLHSSYEQKGYRERMLCQSCETKLSKWEIYARALLMGGALLQYRREGTITWVEGIDYPRFKLFQLSILWRADEFAFLSQPGQADIQSDLFYDYRTNVDSYAQ
jgi:hypothetical protein